MYEIIDGKRVPLVERAPAPAASDEEEEKKEDGGDTKVCKVNTMYIIGFSVILLILLLLFIFKEIKVKNVVR